MGLTWIPWIPGVGSRIPSAPLRTGATPRLNASACLGFPGILQDFSELQFMGIPPGTLSVSQKSCSLQEFPVGAEQSTIPEQRRVPWEHAPFPPQPNRNSKPESENPWKTPLSHGVQPSIQARHLPRIQPVLGTPNSHPVKLQPDLRAHPGFSKTPPQNPDWNSSSATTFLEKSQG